MPDKKISQLSSASTPLAGTEVLPIVQSNATVKTTVSSITDRLNLGTIATQAANNVSISGGTINNTSIGATTPASGKFTSFDVTPSTKRGLRHVQGQVIGLGTNPSNVTVFSINVPYSVFDYGPFGVFDFAGSYGVANDANQVSQRTVHFRIIFSRTGNNTGGGNTTAVVTIEASGDAYSEIGSLGSSASVSLTASVPAASTATQTVAIQLSASTDSPVISSFQWSGMYMGDTDVTFS